MKLGLNLVRVSGEFQLPEFELSRFYCIQLFQKAIPAGKLRSDHIT